MKLPGGLERGALQPDSILREEAIALCETTAMDKTIRRYTNFDEMKADEYRYWQSRPVHERVAAVWELTEEGYKLKGFKSDAFRLQRTLVHFQRGPRWYLIIGAYAVAIHAQPRATKHIDILVKADPGELHIARRPA